MPFIKKRTNTSTPLDLSQLRALEREKPRTKVGQVRQAWPEINRLLALGHRLKDVCERLNQGGLEIGNTRLSDYVNRLRREDEARQTPTTVVAAPTASRSTGVAEPPQRDPLANYKRGMANRPGFHYKPFHPDDTEKLIGFKPLGS